MSSWQEVGRLERLLEVSAAREQALAERVKALESLVGVAMRNLPRTYRLAADPVDGLPAYRWALVKDAFCVGSQTAAQMCRDYGLDPNEMIEHKD